MKFVASFWISTKIVHIVGDILFETYARGKAF